MEIKIVEGVVRYKFPSDNGWKTGHWNVCLECEKKFPAYSKQKKPFCSSECRESHYYEILDCANCGAEVRKRKSKLGAEVFCGLDCLGQYRRVDKSGKQAGSKKVARRIFREKIGECQECGESRDFTLCVHHKDGDNKNDVEENWEVLCANCHRSRHLKFRADGTAYYSALALTDRSLLPVK